MDEVVGDTAIEGLRPATSVHRCSPAWLSWTALGLLVMAAAYVLLPLFEGRFILQASGNVPISDTWNFLPTFVAFAHGGHIPWSFVFAGYGANRPALQKLGMLYFARYLSFNLQLMKLGSVLLGILQTVCLVIGVRLAIPRGRLSVVLLAAYPLALATFCLDNWQNLLEEWAVMNTASVALTTLALLLIAIFRSGTHARPWLFVAAIVVLTVNLFAGEAGLLSWLACSIVLLCPLSRDHLRYTCLFLAIEVVFLVTYLHGINGTSTSYAFSHPRAALHFAVVMLGNGVFGTYKGVNELTLALGIGIAELVLVGAAAVLLLRSDRLRRESAALMGAGLIAFGLVGAASTAVARLSYGFPTAVASRYAIITAPTAWGLYLIGLTYARVRMESKGQARLPILRLSTYAASIALAVAITTTAVVADVDQSRIARYRRDYYVALERAACFPASATDSEMSNFNDPNGISPSQRAQLEKGIAGLRRERLALFSGDRCAEFGSG
jgi:hypothetical protein